MLDMKHVYKTVYATEKEYGTVNHGGPFQQVILDMKPVSLLDIGCGDGSFLAFMQGKDIEVLLMDDEIDVVREGKGPIDLLVGH